MSQMCLRISKQVRIRFNTEGWAICYKELHEDDNLAPFTSSKYRLGVRKSTRRGKKELSKLEQSTGTVDKGIHVLVKKPSQWLFVTDGKIIEVWCHRDDLVASGYFDIWGNKYQSAVFTQVTVKSLDCILKKKKKVTNA